jgi:hypothetical protein
MLSKMKLPALLCLIAMFPAFSHAEEKDDGDWEFLKSRLPEKSGSGIPRVPEDITNTFRFFPAAFKLIESADKITVFEGMPHQGWEGKLLERELARVDETMIGEFPFYPHPQEFREKDEPSLRKILRLPECFRPFLSRKMCGGFHPDYAIRFTKGDEHCDLLLCFGCGDAHILHKGKVIHCHIFRKEWQELLAGYAKHRPKPEE